MSACLTFMLLTLNSLQVFHREAVAALEGAAEASAEIEGDGAEAEGASEIEGGAEASAEIEEEAASEEEEVIISTLFQAFIIY